MKNQAHLNSLKIRGCGHVQNKGFKFIQQNLTGRSESLAGHSLQGIGLQKRFQ